MRRRHFLSIFASAAPAFAGIRSAGRYTGTVLFDRWGGCRLYSGVYLMEVSEAVKHLLRPFAGQSLIINAKRVHQPVNPGDGLIQELQVISPAVDWGDLVGLRLSATAHFAGNGPEALVIEMFNGGSLTFEIDTEQLAPTIFAAKRNRQTRFFFCPSDGPSYALETRLNVALLAKSPEGRNLRLASPLPARRKLPPGDVLSVRLTFQLDDGEYEFISGYGGGVHTGRSIVTNPVAFDVREGKAHAL